MYRFYVLCVILVFTETLQFNVIYFCSYLYNE